MKFVNEYFNSDDRLSAVEMLIDKALTLNPSEVELVQIQNLESVFKINKLKNLQITSSTRDIDYYNETQLVEKDIKLITFIYGIAFFLLTSSEITIKNTSVNLFLYLVNYYYIHNLNSTYI